MSALTLKELENIEQALSLAKRSFPKVHESLVGSLLEERLPELISLARRQLEQQDLGKREAPSSTSQTEMRQEADVPPLGDVTEDGIIYFDDATNDSCKMALTMDPDRIFMEGDRGGLTLDKSRIKSLIAHLQSWLLTGSFELGNHPVQSDSGWRDIATAKKDGTEYLLFWPYWHKTPVVGHWNSGQGQWWSDCVLSDGPPPTHWRPLPPTPSLTADQ